MKPKTDQKGSVVTSLKNTFISRLQPPQLLMDAHVNQSDIIHPIEGKEEHLHGIFSPQSVYCLLYKLAWWRMELPQNQTKIFSVKLAQKIQ